MLGGEIHTLLHLVCVPKAIKFAINSNYQRVTSWKITFYYMIKVKLQLDDDNVYPNRFTCVFPEQSQPQTPLNHVSLPK